MHFKNPKNLFQLYQISERQGCGSDLKCPYIHLAFTYRLKFSSNFQIANFISMYLYTVAILFQVPHCNAYIPHNHMYLILIYLYTT